MSCKLSLISSCNYNRTLRIVSPMFRMANFFPRSYRKIVYSTRARDFHNYSRSFWLVYNAVQLVSPSSALGLRPSFLAVTLNKLLALTVVPKKPFDRYSLRQPPEVPQVILETINCGLVFQRGSWDGSCAKRSPIYRASPWQPLSTAWSRSPWTGMCYSVRFLYLGSVGRCDACGKMFNIHLLEIDARAHASCAC